MEDEHLWLPLAAVTSESLPRQCYRCSRFQPVKSRIKSLSFVGPSGCGKVHRLHAIRWRWRRSLAAKISIGDRLINDVPRKTDIAMVFQNYALCTRTVTVYRTWLSVWSCARCPKDEIDKARPRGC